MGAVDRNRIFDMLVRALSDRRNDANTMPAPKVDCGHRQDVSPEAELWCAVIAWAIADNLAYLKTNGPDREVIDKMTASTFFTNGSLEAVCEAVGLETDYVREIAQKYWNAKGKRCLKSA